MNKNESSSSLRKTEPFPVWDVNGRLVAGLTFLTASGEVLISKDGASPPIAAAADIFEVGRGFYLYPPSQSETNIGIGFMIFAIKKALIDLATHTTNCNTKVRAKLFGISGNDYTLTWVQDAAVSPTTGTLVLSGTDYTFTYKDGTTTVANFESLITASAHLEVATAGTTATLHTIDAFGPINLTNGVEAEVYQAIDQYEPGIDNKLNTIVASLNATDGAHATCPLGADMTLGDMVLEARLGGVAGNDITITVVAAATTLALVSDGDHVSLGIVIQAGSGYVAGDQIALVMDGSGSGSAAYSGGILTMHAQDAVTTYGDIAALIVTGSHFAIVSGPSVPTDTIGFLAFAATTVPDGTFGLSEVGSAITLSLGTTQTSDQIETLIQNESTLARIFRSDSDITRAWTGVTGGPFAFSGGTDESAGIVDANVVEWEGIPPLPLDGERRVQATMNFDVGDIAIAVWAAVAESSDTYGDFMRLFRAVMAGLASGFDTGTITFKRMDGATVALTVITNSTGRTIVTPGTLTP